MSVFWAVEDIEIEVHLAAPLLCPTDQPIERDQTNPGNRRQFCSALGAIKSTLRLDVYLRE